MSFNPEKHIEKMEPSVKKLLAQLKSKGIEFTPQDESGFKNVVFKSSDKTVKISQHSFYRFSGIAEQFIATKGLFFLELKLWIDLAITSFPVPVAP